MSTAEQQMREFYNLTDDEWQRLRSMTFDKRIYEYIGRKFWLLELADSHRDLRYDLNSLQRWQSSYQAIRDASWPDCDTFSDFAKLPVHIQIECRDVHGLDPDQWLDPDIPFDQWQPDINWDYQATELIRLNNIVFENIEFIRNKVVVDFATHNGIVGATCLHHGAKSVTITNIKPDCLRIANEMLDLVDQDQRHRALLGDIHDTMRNRFVCQGADTVILAGIMDIVQEHYSILKSVADSGPNCVIIENFDPVVISNTSEPLVHWWQEVSHTSWRAYSPDLKSIMVGCPNTAWFDFVMSGFGYKKHREKGFQVWDSFIDNLSDPEKDLFDRKLLVYVK